MKERQTGTESKPCCYYSVLQIWAVIVFWNCDVEVVLQLYVALIVCNGVFANIWCWNIWSTVVVLQSCFVLVICKCILSRVFHFFCNPVLQIWVGVVFWSFFEILFEHCVHQPLNGRSVSPMSHHWCWYWYCYWYWFCSSLCWSFFQASVSESWIGSVMQLCLAIVLCYGILRCPD